MFYQQGDVLMIQVKGIPEGAQETEHGGRVVLAQGEATGHTHVIIDTEVETFTLADAFFVRMHRPVEVSHEEHNTVILPPGTRQVRQVQEYDHFAEEARVVAD